MVDTNERIGESDLQESRQHVIVLVGDINGFGRWARKCAEDPIAYKKFMAHLYDAFLEYKKATGAFIKLLGDGILAVSELEGGREAEISEKIFLQSLKLREVIKTSIMGQMFPRPDGFRIRLVAGNVWKVVLRMNGDRLTDYNGYWMNAPFRFSDLFKNISCMAHTSAVELLPDDFTERTRVAFTKLAKYQSAPDGIDPEDMAELHEFGIRPDAVS